MTIRRPLNFIALIALAFAMQGCNGFTWEPRQEAPAIAPDEISDFRVLYGQNCAGCHGADGRNGAALSLDNPLYLAIVDNATLGRITAEGVPHTMMPAFARKSGGMLTEKQIDIIVSGMRSNWANPGFASGEALPAYASPVSGDVQRGAEVYHLYCASCHGNDGRGGPHGSSIVDDAYLALVSDQSLRTTVIVGRPELGAPDWRGNVPGRVMSATEISDVVAWIASQRISRPEPSKPNPTLVSEGHP
jgi:cytochrome c oxidase cbb3-type subunit III